MKNILVLGGDERNYYLCRSLIEKGFSVKWLFAEKAEYTDSFIERENHKTNNAYAVILPLPLTKDKITLNAPLSENKMPLSELSFSEDTAVFTSSDIIDGINYFENEAVTIDNARLTAQGFLCELLIYEKENIMGKNALITGYGRVSQAVSEILQRNGVSVTVAARNENQRHTAESRGLDSMTIEKAKENLFRFDYVINTVPKRLFSGESIKKADSETVFFELASDMIDKAEFTPKAYIECRGMPGKHTPKSAGEVIADFIARKLRE